MSSLWEYVFLRGGSTLYSKWLFPASCLSLPPKPVSSDNETEKPYPSKHRLTERYVSSSANILKLYHRLVLACTRFSIHRHHSCTGSSRLEHLSRASYSMFQYSQHLAPSEAPEPPSLHCSRSLVVDKAPQACVQSSP